MLLCDLVQWFPILANGEITKRLLVGPTLREDDLTAWETSIPLKLPR